VLKGITHRYDRRAGFERLLRQVNLRLREAE
jgi:hypothetical protein